MDSQAYIRTRTNVHTCTRVINTHTPRIHSVARIHSVTCIYSLDTDTDTFTHTPLTRTHALAYTCTRTTRWMVKDINAHMQTIGEHYRWNVRGDD